MRSTFLLTVPQALYDAVCDACGQPFADSYLYGAELQGRALWPRTRIGWERMRERRDFTDLVKRLGLTLEKPEPYPGDGTRLPSPEIETGGRGRRREAA